MEITVPLFAPEEYPPPSEADVEKLGEVFIQKQHPIPLRLVSSPSLSPQVIYVEKPDYLPLAISLIGLFALFAFLAFLKR